MNDQKIIKEALNLIDRCLQLEATSRQIRENSGMCIAVLKNTSNVDYETLTLPGTADIVALANRVNTIGTVLDCYICLAAEVNSQLNQG